MNIFRKVSDVQLVISVAACALMLAACRSKAPVLDDTTLLGAVQSRLQADPGLAGEVVQVSVQGGRATLTGSVSSEAARALAANDAAEVVGVRTVENDLGLNRRPTSAASDRQAPVVGGSRKAERPLNASNGQVSVPIERRDPNQPDAHPAMQPGRSVPPPPPVAPAAPSFRNVTVPVGTGIPVRITETLDSATTQPGSSFSGVVASDVIVDGLVAFPSGTRVTGHVDDAKDAGHFSGNSLLAVSLTGISRRGESMTITTDTFSKEGKGRGKNTAEKVGGGAAVGAILGGIFGGGKGAAIGAGAGGGLGAGANGVTRGEQVQIPSESLVRFRLTTPVTVRAGNPGDADSEGGLRQHDQ